MMDRIVLIFWILFAALFISNSYAMPEQKNQAARGAAILREIEPNFTKSPIFLNPDQNFKEANKQKLLEAIGYLEKGLSEHRDNAHTLYLLGTAYSFAHDLNIAGAWEKSMEYLNKAIEADPSDFKSHMILGKNFMDAGRFDESFQEYKRVNDFVPNGFALRNMAFVRMAQKRTVEAQTLLEKYIKHNPKDKDAPKILIALREGKFESPT